MIEELHIKAGSGLELYYYDVKPEEVTIYKGRRFGDWKWFITVRDNEYEIGSHIDVAGANHYAKIQKQRVESELKRYRDLLKGVSDDR